MKTLFQIILFGLVSYSSNAQNIDSIRKKKWLVSSKIESPGFGTNENWNRKYLTSNNDTLERYFKYTYSVNRGSILYEFNSVNVKLNGVCIGYHTNGLIYSIKYYLNDKLWETNLLIDSFGKQHFPGNLLNGTGTVYDISDDGHDLGYTTYKNGNTDGKFYQIDRDGTMALEGQLLYSEEFIKYDTITIINYINEYKDTLSASFVNGEASDSISNSFKVQENNPKIKLLNKKELIVAIGEENRYLNIYLDPGVIPIGEWKLSNPKKKDTYITYKFDNVGKLKSETNYKLKQVTDFNIDGSVRQQHSILR